MPNKYLKMHTWAQLPSNRSWNRARQRVVILGRMELAYSVILPSRLELLSPIRSRSNESGLLGRCCNRVQTCSTKILARQMQAMPSLNGKPTVVEVCPIQRATLRLAFRGCHRIWRKLGIRTTGHHSVKEITKASCCIQAYLQIQAGKTWMLHQPMTRGASIDWLIKARRCTRWENRTNLWACRIRSRIQAQGPRGWCRNLLKAEMGARIWRPHQAEKNFSGRKRRISMPQIVLIIKINNVKDSKATAVGWLSREMSLAQRLRGRILLVNSSSGSQPNLMSLEFQASWETHSLREPQRCQQSTILGTKSLKTKEVIGSLMKFWLAAQSFSSQSWAISI